MYKCLLVCYLKTIHVNVSVNADDWLFKAKMLHQIKAQQIYTNFLVLISPLSQSSISEVEF